jgi:ribonuclease J
MPPHSSDETVQLCIHRAADAIGGNCVEIAVGEQRLLLDAGLPLDGVATKAAPLPPTLELSRPIAGVLLSHLHGDHAGAVPYLPLDWKVFCGGPTAMTLGLLSRLDGHDVRDRLHRWFAGEALSLGPFTVIPRLIDHSAYDAYMLEIVAAGKRILYSGDFRRHGRQSAFTDGLFANPPADVDVLILEGTNLFRLGQTRKPSYSESDLEDKLVELFTKTGGRVFATWSATNLDRTVTMANACQRTGRTLVLDSFTMSLLDGLREFYPDIPSYTQEAGIRPITVVTNGMNQVLRSLYGHTDFIGVLKKAHAAMSAGALRSSPEKLVIMARDSLARDYRLKGVRPTSEDAWVWSQWSGYLEKENTKLMRQYFQPCGEPVRLHTSGHASPEDLMAFARAVNPGMIIPVHGEGWEHWSDRFAKCRRVSNGEWLEL